MLDVGASDLMLGVEELKDYLLGVGWRLMSVGDRDGLYVLENCLELDDRKPRNPQIVLPRTCGVSEARVHILKALRKLAIQRGTTPLAVWLSVPVVREKVLKWVSGCDPLTQGEFVLNLSALLEKGKIKFGRDFL